MGVRWASVTCCPLAFSPATPGYPLSVHGALVTFLKSSTTPSWPRPPPGCPGEIDSAEKAQRASPGELDVVVVVVLVVVGALAGGEVVVVAAGLYLCLA